jgi:hypothetical protein
MVRRTPSRGPSSCFRPPPSAAPVLGRQAVSLEAGGARAVRRPRVPCFPCGREVRPRCARRPPHTLHTCRGATQAGRPEVCRPRRMLHAVLSSLASARGKPARAGPAAPRDGPAGHSITLPGWLRVACSPPPVADCPPQGSLPPPEQIELHHRPQEAKGASSQGATPTRARPPCRAHGRRLCALAFQGRLLTHYGPGAPTSADGEAPPLKRGAQPNLPRRQEKGAGLA